MRSIIRLVAASALSLPIVIGAAGIASADVEFDQNNASASADGATLHDLASGADGEGNSYFYESYELAGPYGAGNYTLLTWTYQGGAGYFDQYAWSSPDGAWVGSTSATADDGHWVTEDADADVSDDLDE
ncbi:hypothetical protein IOD16_39620 [Saccharothrix sp. 6-C]|uniref:hypothetical protein n=1 Tax=Saccharothrix sp. 6-C TaxID=2781735 RepID=UPI0019170764|nr:hypothetical protein [Saccharothrix sp. 6-C]QQQ76984.1 hypothetical protein IOD16_39620 [Saccharothrix sp. 6-C]